MYVKLTGGEPTEKPWVWRVAAIAVEKMAAMLSMT